MIKVLVADDHAIIREGLKRILEGSDVQIVAEAATGPETLEKARKSRPDIVLLDVSMPGGDGLETAKDLKRQNPKVRVLMLTVHPEDNFAVRCLTEGADGYMTKDAAPEQLIQALRRIQKGGKYISPNLAERLALNLGEGSDRPAHDALSTRELAVMRRIASGKTVSEIAAELNLSVKTISTYRHRILEKMNLRNNSEIVRYAVGEGLTD
jgi:two-component system, NarL family, invasion response regulator UvrY